MTWTTEPHLNCDCDKLRIRGPSNTDGLFNPEDAILIAAAPDLLAALKLLKDRGILNHDTHGRTCDCGINEAEAAIAKAEGSNVG
jgi:hypothetical protein